MQLLRYKFGVLRVASSEMSIEGDKMETNFSSPIASKYIDKTATDPTKINAPLAEDEADLGKNDFLQLLTTQLEHQDPLEPMSNQEFIAQLAQFNSLNELKTLNKQMATLVELQKVQEPSEEAVEHGLLEKTD